MLGIIVILTLVLCSCLGQPVSQPQKSPDISSQEHQEGLVFIHMGSSLYSLPCNPREMKVAEATYEWVQDGAVSRSLSVTKEGRLLLQHFQADNSGKYSCTISYRKNGVPASQTFHYSILGYHVLGGLDIVLLFHSKLCKDEWTKSFLWSLQKQLRQLETEQHCKIQVNDTFCFPSLSNSSGDFIVQVQLEVSLFGPNWDQHCKPEDMETLTDCYRSAVRENLWQVQLALNRFFREHKIFPITGANIPSVNFTNDFVGILQSRQCTGGYGQTKQMQSCLDCCIVCPPGTFSPPKYSQCFPCPLGTYSLIYGAAFCTACKNGTVTRSLGASSMTDCIKKERTKHGVTPTHTIPGLVLFILSSLLTINLLFILSSCCWFLRECWVSDRKNCKDEDSEQLLQDPEADPDAEPTSDPSPLDTSASQPADEKHKHGAASLAVNPNLFTLTNETIPMLTLQD
ncbi:ZPBP2 protein, partial [Galbula dea]|nr:ZPBP2 protein [Galbula dea]